MSFRSPVLKITVVLSLAVAGMIGCSEEAFVPSGAALPELRTVPDTVEISTQYGSATVNSPYLFIRSSDPFKQVSFNVYSDAPWLKMSRDTGTTPDSFFVKVDPAGLKDSTHVDSLTFTSVGAANSPVQAIFRLQIITSLVAKPTIVTRWLSQADSPFSNDTIFVWAGDTLGTVEVSWNADHLADWFTLNKYSGITPDTIVVDYEDTTFEIGSHIGEIDLSSSDISGATNVRIRMNITSWTKQDPPLEYSSKDIKAVSFADSVNGWAVIVTSGQGPTGQDEEVGIVIGTNDGGANWTKVYETDPYYNSSTAKPRGLGGVFFRDALKGWAVGGTGTIIHTANGGHNWEYQAGNLNISEDLQDVFFASSLNGWAVGKNGRSVRTVDGGDHWTVTPVPGNPDLFAVMFADNLHGWKVGNGGKYFYTTNGGNNWFLGSLPAPYDNYDLRGVSFADIFNGWIVGENGLILYSDDGGKSWTAQNSGTTESLEAVEFVSKTRGWAVGNNSTILFTDDGGVTWQTQELGGIENFWFHDLDFVRPSDTTQATSGWLVGDGGVIFKGRFAGDR